MALICTIRRRDYHILSSLFVLSLLVFGCDRSSTSELVRVS